PRGCEQGMSSAELEERIKNNANCIKARSKINSRCFNGGDAGHIEAIQVAVNSLARCHRIKSRIRVPNPEPIVSPEAARRIALATSIGAGAGMVIGAVIGAVGGGGGGTLVAPGVGTIGGG